MAHIIRGLRGHQNLIRKNNYGLAVTGVTDKAGEIACLFLRRANSSLAAIFLKCRLQMQRANTEILAAPE
jgi:hypothetical protein